MEHIKILELHPPDPRSTCYIVYDPSDGSRYAQELAKGVQATGHKVAALEPEYVFRRPSDEARMSGQRQFDLLVFVATAQALGSQNVVEHLRRATEAGLKKAVIVVRSLLPDGNLLPKHLAYFPTLYLDEEESGFRDGIPSRSALNQVEGALHGFDIGNRN